MKNYWAKDLIFLVTCGEEVGMQAWVDQYMGLTTGMLYPHLSFNFPFGHTLEKKEGEKKIRSRQDSNLRGQSPIDF